MLKLSSEVRGEEKESGSDVAFNQFTYTSTLTVFSSCSTLNPAFNKRVAKNDKSMKTDS